MRHARAQPPIAAELGEWAGGHALDRLSGAKARRELGCRPRYLDPEREIGRLARPDAMWPSS